MPQIINGVDVSNDTGIVSLKLVNRKLLQQAARTFIASQFHQAIEMFMAECDRIAAPPVVYRYRNPVSIPKSGGQAAYRLRFDVWHVSQRDHPATGITRVGQCVHE